MRLRKPVGGVIGCMIFAIVACVTINIYFPAEKVQSVAEDIVNEVTGKTGDEGDPAPKGDKNSFLRDTLFAAFVSTAWAEGATTVSNPTIRSLKQSMASKFSRMRPYYQKGAIKEGGNGYVQMGNTQGLALKDKRTVMGLVDAMNSDRKRLYAEVAKAMEIDPSQISKIEAIFAKEWQKAVR
jgi:hypothetical protein